MFTAPDHAARFMMFVQNKNARQKSQMKLRFFFKVNSTHVVTGTRTQLNLKLAIVCYLSL